METNPLEIVQEHPASEAFNPQFDFVSINHPDELKGRLVKRQIHQHVMKKIGMRRRKKTTTFRHGTELQLVTTQGLAMSKDCGPDMVLYSPIEVRAQRMNDFLFRRHSAFCMKLRELCFSLAMFDDGIYYLALAETALHRENAAKYTLPHEENAVSLRYYAQSVAHINQNMLYNVATKVSGHGLMVAILGLASYDVSVGNMHRWEMHMTGLETLINHYASLQTFYRSSFFMFGLLLTETTGCLVLDRRPHVDIPLDMMQPYHEPIEHPVLARNLTTLRSLDPQLEDVASILELLTGLTKSFELQKTGGDDQYRVYCITRARISYLLLHVPRANLRVVQDPKSASICAVLREMIRLATLAFLLQLVGFGSALPYHAARLAELLNRHEWHWKGLSELHLWVITIAAVTTDDPRHRTLLAARVAILKDELGLPWDRLAVALQQVAWADGLFQHRLRELGALASPTVAPCLEWDSSDQIAFQAKYCTAAECIKAQW